MKQKGNIGFWLLHLTHQYYKQILFSYLNPMPKHQQNKRDLINMQSYYSIKEDLESEQAALLRERQHLHQQSHGNHPSHSAITQGNKHYDSLSPHGHFSSSNTHQQRSVVDTLRSKIEEVIELCYGQDNNEDYNELLEVVKAQQEVLNFLNGLTTARQTVREVNRNSKQEGSRKKESNRKRKVDKTYEHENSSIDIYKKYNLSEDAMELIQEIQRKALFEIESLRRDKVNLMKRLNEEMRTVNHQKRSQINTYQGASQGNNPQRIRGKAKHQMEIVDEEQNSQNYENEGHENLRQKSHSLHDPTSHSKLKGKRQRTEPYFNQREDHVEVNGEGGAEQLMRSHIDKITKQNERIRRSITQVPDNSQLKAHLRWEVGQLCAKIRQYESLITNSRRRDGGINQRQYQQLLIQGNSITEQGNRLLHQVASNPSRSNVGSHTYQDVNYEQRKNESKARVRATEDYSRPFLQTFSPMDRSFHSQAYKKGFSPTQYEAMIEQMRNATKE